VLCLVGSFAIASRVFDVGVMVAFGLIGFAMRLCEFPVAPMILGVVLGDLLDKNLRRGLVLSEGDVSAFFTRPISAVLWVLIAAILLSRVPVVERRLSRVWQRLVAGRR
jgi:putative tricarboxylic transport membrane protein